jgi:hypothetical protein
VTSIFWVSMHYPFPKQPLSDTKLCTGRFSFQGAMSVFLFTDLARERNNLYTLWLMSDKELVFPGFHVQRLVKSHKKMQSKAKNSFCHFTIGTCCILFYNNLTITYPIFLMSYSHCSIGIAVRVVDRDLWGWGCTKYTKWREKEMIQNGKQLHLAIE